jgi:hypothetical protein
VVLTVLTGWSGRLQPAFPTAAVQTASRLFPASDERAEAGSAITFTLQDGADGSMVLSAVSANVSLRKQVYADGRTTSLLERGRDRVRITTRPSTILLARGARTQLLHIGNPTEEQLARARRLLSASPAIRALRLLATAFDEGSPITMEMLAVRVSMGLVAQLDGDPSALHRLSRELHAQFRAPRDSPHFSPSPWLIYGDIVTRTTGDLEARLSSCGYWNPSRITYAFLWAQEIEAAWFGCVAR